MEKSKSHTMVRVRRQRVTLPCLFQGCAILLAATSILLLLQSLWGSQFESSGESKSDRLGHKHIYSGIEIERDILPKQNLMNQHCSVPRFRTNSSVPSDVLCRRISPRPGSCQLAHDLYISQRPATCGHQPKHQLCQIKGEGKEVKVECQLDICPGPVSLGTINPAIGVLHWEEMSKMEELQTHLQHLLRTGKPEAAFGFCFIKCPLELQDTGPEEGKVEEDGLEDQEVELESFQQVYMNYEQEENNDNLAQQLLLLPLGVGKQNSHNASHSKKPDLNINVMLLDSVSHSHFYRSLPKTVRALRAIDSQSTHVYSFNLLQSLKGRTYENLEMLFSGLVHDPEKPFGTQDMPPNPIDTRVLLEGYKHRGFDTLWMEDLCWTWEWGVAKNFVVHSPKEMLSFRWQKLKDAMTKAGIDKLGLALANCEILHANGHNDPFHGPPAVCYNGEYQHAFMLHYLQELQVVQEQRGVPFFHYSEFNVGHDDSGLRIQTLDSHLADYLTFTSNLENTLTIIFADHGNSYGTFIQRSEEGRTEMFHPALFIVLSKLSDKLLLPEQLRALRINQDRLVSVMDLHYMLRFLAYPGIKTKVSAAHKNYDANPMGLLKEISPNRTCDDIPRIQPNVCICEDFDTPVQNASSRAIYAEFALGELNNAIQEQFVEGHPEGRTGFGRCRPLQALWFSNVRENFHGNNAIIKFDLYTKAGKNATQTEEIFFVTLETSMNSHHSKAGLRLLSYERLTSYSQYGRCADSGVATKLCVCSLEGLEGGSKQMIDYKLTPSWHEQGSFFAFHTSTIKQVTACLYLYERRSKCGVVLEASCECADKVYLVEVSAKSENVVTSQDLPLKIVLKPGMRTFLIAFTESKAKSNWSLEYSIKYAEHFV